MAGEETESELRNDIEIARHALEGDIEKESREAEEKLDKILSKKDMEFCSRCGRKVEGRMEWAGKCLNKSCENLICRDCWTARKRRFCMEHYKQMVRGKPEEGAREKVFFREEATGPEETIRPELGRLRESREEAGLRERAESLARNYASFLDTRFGSEGVIDFTPEGFFEGPGMETKAKDDETWIRVFRKRFLRTRDILQIIIKPIHADNANYLATKVLDRARGAFSIIVLVGEKSSSSTISFVNKFDSRGASLFLAEPGQGLLYFNDSIPINRLYSVWFNQAKNPLGFREVLQSISERVSNRWVVSAKRVAEDFGYTSKKAREALKSCRFLSPVPDTDQFLFRKEK